MIDYYKLKVYESSIDQTVLSLLHNPIGLNLKEDDTVFEIHKKIMEAREKLEILRMHEIDPKSVSDYDHLEMLLYNMLDIFATEQDKIVYDTTLKYQYEKLREQKVKEKKAKPQQPSHLVTLPQKETNERKVAVKKVVSEEVKQKDRKIIRDAIFLGLSFIILLSIFLIFNLSIQVLGITLIIIVVLTLLLT